MNSISKLLLALAVFVLIAGGAFFYATQPPQAPAPLPNNLSNENTTTKSEELTPASPASLPAEALPPLVFSRESIMVEASSELKDDTGYGFAYSPANVLDLDYSTAWCPDPKDKGPWLRFAFSGEVPVSELKTVGIVPGFARDEKIYLQNNRIRTLQVTEVGETGTSFDIALEDAYEMHFVDLSLGEGTVTGLEWRPTDVYPGLKYNDTCISEIDFWSDWVALRDANAAYNYYEKYKKDSSVRPVRIASVQFSLPGALEACGKFDLSNFQQTSHENSVSYTLWDNYGYSYYDEGDPFYEVPTYVFEPVDSVAFSATLNESALPGDTFLVKLISKSSFDENNFRGPGGPRGPVKTAVWQTDTVAAQGCPDGKLYLSYKIEKMPVLCLFGECSATFYFRDRLVGISPAFKTTQ